MAIKNNREYRNMQIRKMDDQNDEKCIVRGYASTFEPYCLFRDGDTEYFECIHPEAFNEADLSDVIFLYNHEGMVYARQKNGTLKISTDEHGLLTEADLSSTQQSRDLYEAINAGLVDQMSFAFTVREDSYDAKTHTRTILKIDKVYDVSAVSIPANPGTDIATVSARDYFNGVIEAEKAERLEREKKLAVLKAQYDYLNLEV